MARSESRKVKTKTVTPRIKRPGRPLAEAEPLKRGRQILDEIAFAPPAQRFAPSDHGRERHDDRGQAQPRDQRPIDRAQASASDNRERADRGHGPAFRRRERRENATPGKLRADRNIDLPPNDDERRSASREEDRRGLGEDGEQLRRLKKGGREESERREQESQRKGDGNLVEVASHGV